MIHALIEKRLAAEREKACRSNLRLLRRTLSQYRHYESEQIFNGLPHKYETVLSQRKRRQMETWLAAPYEKCPFDPKRHIHETACGQLVRSKSEAIIANALWDYEVPFHYEEKFKYPSANGDFFYPDFTIWMPDGTPLIWEHLGLLSELGYCIENAYKLNAYQLNRFTVGKNLIITQDDNQGNCSSGVIYHIITNYLLPYSKGSRN